MAAEGKKTGFEGLFEETIMNSIRDLLGESSMRAILFHLNLKRLAKDPGVFHQKLVELLSAPASIIEEIIIKDLFKSLDLFYAPMGPFDFSRYAETARQVYASREKKGHG